MHLLFVKVPLAALVSKYVANLLWVSFAIFAYLDNGVTYDKVCTEEEEKLFKNCHSLLILHISNSIM